MHAQKRRFEPAVIERLFKEPYRFEYFQAVRVLGLWLRRHGGPAKGQLHKLLRFQNSTSLGFPASQLEAIHTEPRDIDRGAHALHAAVQSGTLQYIRVTPTFMGLLGGSGVLPLHYTERVDEHHAWQREDGPRAFLDTFSNRSLAMFHEAWCKYRLELKYEAAGTDAFLPLLLALAGVGNASLRERLAGDGDGRVLDESLGYFAASLRHRPVSAVQLARVLSEYFGRPIKAVQFVGCWYEVPAAQQSILGAGAAVLGAGAMAGDRVWQRDLRLRLEIGPLDHAGFNAFLPGGLAARALKSMLTMFTGVALEYEVAPVLRAADVRGVDLAADGDPGRLGWDAYLVTGPQEQDRSDVCYEIHAI